MRSPRHFIYVVLIYVIFNICVANKSFIHINDGNNILWFENRKNRLLFDSTIKMAAKQVSAQNALWLTMTL
jgi:hypothetical protein